MTLHISEAEVRAVLTMPLAVEAVKRFRAAGHGGSGRAPAQAIRIAGRPDSFLYGGGGFLRGFCGDEAVHVCARQAAFSGATLRRWSRATYSR